MLTIDLHFSPYEETLVSALLGSIGVYTVWSPQATDRPTYLGEGHVITRLPQHVDTWKRGITGVIAIISTTSQEKKVGKFVSTLAEAFLLQLGDLLGRAPTQNSAPGYTGLLRDVIENENKIRLNLFGMNPFTHPKGPRTRLRWAR